MAKKTISMRSNLHENSAAVIEETEAMEEKQAVEQTQDTVVSEIETKQPSAPEKKPSAGGTFGDAMKRGIILENPVLRRRSCSRARKNSIA